MKFGWSTSRYSTVLDLAPFSTLSGGFNDTRNTPTKFKRGLGDREGSFLADHTGHSPDPIVEEHDVATHGVRRRPREGSIPEGGRKRGLQGLDRKEQGERRFHDRPSLAQAQVIDFM